MEFTEEFFFAKIQVLVNALANTVPESAREFVGLYVWLIALLYRLSVDMTTEIDADRVPEHVRQWMTTLNFDALYKVTKVNTLAIVVFKQPGTEFKSPPWRRIRCGRAIFDLFVACFNSSDEEFEQFSSVSDTFYERMLLSQNIRVLVRLLCQTSLCRGVTK